MLEGAITLPNGISLPDAVVRVESLSDSSANEIISTLVSNRDEMGKETIRLEYQSMPSGRHVYFRAQLFANMETLAANRPVCFIEQEDGNSSFRLFPDESVTGMALVDLAEKNLIELFPGLARVE